MCPVPEHLPSPFAGMDDRVARPGDPDLDLHVTGLRITEVVILAGAYMTEFTVTFDASGGGGYWSEAATGEGGFPDRMTRCEITAGLVMQPGFGWLLDLMLGRLEAWRADGALVAVTGAPGKWTLLHSPRHPAGPMVLVPRGGLRDGSAREEAAAAPPSALEMLTAAACAR